MVLSGSVCTETESTCLNWIMMSLDSSMSLNIPSSLLVNAAPHSGGSQNHKISQLTSSHTTNAPLTDFVCALSAMKRICKDLLDIVL